MRFVKPPIFLLGLILFTGTPVRAQGRSEIALSLGAGSLKVDPGGGKTVVFSLSYQFHITRHFSAEGALDSFSYKFPIGPPDSSSIYKDGYLGAEAAVVYHFLPNRDKRRWLPFLVAGIGKTTTDFTEIAAHPYYRLGAGVSYHLNDRLGFRLEVRDEIITRLASYSSPRGNLPSIRCGIVYRFH